MSDAQAAYLMGAAMAAQFVYWSYRAFVCQLDGWVQTVIELQSAFRMVRRILDGTPTTTGGTDDV